jgi:hypothetical protein
METIIQADLKALLAQEIGEADEDERETQGSQSSRTIMNGHSRGVQENPSIILTTGGDRVEDSLPSFQDSDSTFIDSSLELMDKQHTVKVAA